MERLRDTIFYSLEKSIKSYRQFAQKNIDQIGLDITIDQWLVLRLIQEHSDITQTQLSSMVFKDYASVTRIINLLVEKKFLRRTEHPKDRRRFELRLTEKGDTTIAKLLTVIEKNRETALRGISAGDMKLLNQTLNTIIENCTQSKLD